MQSHGALRLEDFAGEVADLLGETAGPVPEKARSLGVLPRGGSRWFSRSWEDFAGETGTVFTVKPQHESRALSRKEDGSGLAQLGKTLGSKSMCAHA